MRWGAQHILQPPADELHGGTPARCTPLPPQGAWPFPVRRGQPWSTMAWAQARAMSQRRAPGWAELSPLPGAALVPGQRGSPASFPAPPKEPHLHGALPKRLLRRASGGQAPQDPSAADRTPGERAASFCPPDGRSRWGCPRAPRVPRGTPRETGALVFWGEMRPRSGLAREVRLATPSPPAQQPEGGGSNAAAVTEQRAGRSGGWLTLPGAARGWAALHHAPPWSLAAAGFWHSSCSPPPESRPAPCRCQNAHGSRRGNRDQGHAVLRGLALTMSAARKNKQLGIPFLGRNRM